MNQHSYSIRTILDDPSVRNIVKDHLKAFQAKDPCDAANDAELIARVLRERVNTLLEKVNNSRRGMP